MYMVNTYRWDYPLVAALVAPRPLLISNTDSDRIFPLDGVYRTFVKTRKIYQLYGAADKIALNITAGPHKDTQELRVHAFRWLNHHLRQDDSLIRFPAEKFFQPEQLKVFQRIPADQKNTTIQETFVAPGQVPVPPDLTTWKKMAKQLRESVRKKCFQGWPEIESPLNLQVLGSSPTGIGKLRRFDYSFSSQPHVELGFSLFTTGKPDQVRYCLVLIAGEGNADRVDADNVLTENNRGFFRLRLDDATADRIETIDEFFRNPDRAVVVFSPRGIGKYAWQCDSRFQTQLRRRFYLLGQTVDTMRIYDIKRALKALKQVTGESSNGSTDRPKLSLAVAGDGTMAVNAAYATILGADVNRLQLYQPPTSHRNGPYLLNIRRILDVPHAIALAADKTELLIRTPSADDFVFPVNTNRLSGGAPRLLIISD